LVLPVCFPNLPSRLREGSGEGVFASRFASELMIDMPSPNPSRKREGDCIRYYAAFTASKIAAARRLRNNRGASILVAIGSQGETGCADWRR